MSEDSEDKTKRKYVRELLAYPWTHQTSIFFEPENTCELLPEMARVKQLLRKAYPDTPFLLRVAKYNQGRGRNIGWVSILTIKKLDELEEKLSKWVRVDVNVRNRAISSEKRLKTAQTILKQRPHDLQKLFGLTPEHKINRYSILNRDSLPEAGDALFSELKEDLEE